MSAVTEARIVGLRREHPGWGPSRIRWQLEREGLTPLPGRSAVYRALVRHGLIVPGKRRPAAGGLPPVGAGPGDGAVADGRDGRTDTCAGNLPPRGGVVAVKRQSWEPPVLEAAATELADTLGCRCYRDIRWAMAP
jgi:hypothetical protein